MTKTDLRTIGREKRKALRERAMMTFQASQNVLATANKLGINRQVLHSWIKKHRESGNLDENRGRITRRLYKAQAKQLLEALTNNLPRGLGINGIFWSVSSFRELVKNKFDIDLSTYLARRLLDSWGFPKRKQIGIFERPSSDTAQLPLYEYAKQHNMLCYCLRKIDVHVSSSVHSFYCIISTRGDLRFVGSQYLSEDSKSWFISKLYQVAKKNMVVALDIYITTSGKQDISANIILFGKVGGRLERIKE